MTSPSKMHCKRRDFFKSRDADPCPRTTACMMRSKQVSQAKVRSVSLLVAWALSLMTRRRDGNFKAKSPRRNSGWSIFAGKLLVGGTVSGEHLDGVQDVDLRFKVSCSPGPAGIQARMRRPSCRSAPRLHDLLLRCHTVCRQRRESAPNNPHAPQGGSQWPST